MCTAHSTELPLLHKVPPSVSQIAQTRISRVPGGAVLLGAVHTPTLAATTGEGHLMPFSLVHLLTFTGLPDCMRPASLGAPRLGHPQPVHNPFFSGELPQVSPTPASASGG